MVALLGRAFRSAWAALWVVLMLWLLWTVFPGLELSWWRGHMTDVLLVVGLAYAMGFWNGGVFVGLEALSGSRRGTKEK